MTINESIDTQKEIERLEALIAALGDSDPLRAKYYRQELKYYEELDAGSRAKCVKNSRLCEIARLQMDREAWLQSALSPCERERQLAGERLIAIDSTINIIKYYMEKEGAKCK